MSRPVQIVATLVLFLAVMLAFGAVTKPLVHGGMDWLYARIGVEWTCALLATVIVPPGLWGYWHCYKASRVTGPARPPCD